MHICCYAPAHTPEHQPLWVRDPITLGQVSILSNSAHRGPADKAGCKVESEISGAQWEEKKTEELLEIYGQEQVIFPVWGNDRPTMLWQEGITEYLTPTRCGVGVGGCTHRAECTFTCAGKNGTVFCLFRGQHSIHPGHEIAI